MTMTTTPTVAHIATVRAFVARLSNLRAEAGFDDEATREPCLRALSDEIQAAGLTAAVRAEMELQGQAALAALDTVAIGTIEEAYRLACTPGTTPDDIADLLASVCEAQGWGPWRSPQPIVERGERR